MKKGAHDALLGHNNTPRGGPDVSAGSAPRLIAFYDSRYVTGRFGDPRPGGRIHEGTDLSHSRTPGLTPVPALLGGQVVNIWAPSTGHGYGHRVDIRTVEGVVSYAHLHTRSPFWMGQLVGQGDTVGHEGTSGFVSGSCVHVEHAVNGRKRDPLPLIRQVLASLAGNAPAGSLTPSEEDDMYDEKARDALFAHVSTEARPVKFYGWGTGTIAMGPGGAFWAIPTPAYATLLDAAGIAGPLTTRNIADQAEMDFLLMIRKHLTPDPVVTAQIEAVLKLSAEDAQRIADAIGGGLADGVADELAERLLPKGR